VAQDNPTEEPVVDWTRVCGGALAAVSSAVLLSTLGVIGTIAGAALGSIVVSVSSSVYARGLHRSRRRMAQAQEAALRRVGIAQAEVGRARRRKAEGATEAHLEQAQEHLAGAKEELATEPEPEQETLKDRLSRLPWRRVALAAGLMFVIAVAAITAFELIAGRPVASFTGGTNSDQGTTIGNVDGGGQGDSTPSPSPTGETSPTSGPETSEPTTPATSPTESPSESPTAPEPTTPGPTVLTPSEEPSPLATEPTPAN
jgi:hypothetical protein